MPAAPKASPASLNAFIPFLIALIAIVFAAAAYFLLFYPKLRLLVRGGELDVSKIQNLIEEEEKRKAMVENIAKNYTALNPARREKVQQAIPLSSDIPGLFTGLDAIAAAHGFVLTSVDATEDTKNTHSGGRRPTEVAANFAGGTYGDFRQLLADVERSDRIFDVRSVIFTPNSGTYSLILRTYHLDKNTAEQGVVPAATVGPPGAPVIATTTKK